MDNILSSHGTVRVIYRLKLKFYFLNQISISKKTSQNQRDFSVIRKDISYQI